MTVGGTFTKTGGAITGTDGPNPNSANSGDGHAVCVEDSGGNDKYRNATAGPTVSLNSDTDTNWGMYRGTLVIYSRSSGTHPSKGFVILQN
ncbi:hypothetical protein FACS1894200_14310 [Spirochaetia bacterium]|nr:hypothetical protein FACS1894200_14310 [Spirochaetia bacterium]